MADLTERLMAGMVRHVSDAESQAHPDE